MAYAALSRGSPVAGAGGRAPGRGAAQPAADAAPASGVSAPSPWWSVVANGPEKLQDSTTKVRSRVARPRSRSATPVRNACNTGCNSASAGSQATWLRNWLRELPSIQDACPSPKHQRARPRSRHRASPPPRAKIIPSWVSTNKRSSTIDRCRNTRKPISSRPDVRSVKIAPTECCSMLGGAGAVNSVCSVVRSTRLRIGLDAVVWSERHHGGNRVHAFAGCDVVRARIRRARDASLRIKSNANPAGTSGAQPLL